MVIAANKQDRRETADWTSPKSTPSRSRQATSRPRPRRARVEHMFLHISRQRSSEERGGLHGGGVGRLRASGNGRNGAKERIISDEPAGSDAKSAAEREGWQPKRLNIVHKMSHCT